MYINFLSIIIKICLYNLLYKFANKILYILLGCASVAAKETRTLGTTWMLLVSQIDCTEALGTVTRKLASPARPNGSRFIPFSRSLFFFFREKVPRFIS